MKTLTRNKGGLHVCDVSREKKTLMDSDYILELSRIYVRLNVWGVWGKGKIKRTFPGFHLRIKFREENQQLHFEHIFWDVVYSSSGNIK